MTAQQLLSESWAVARSSRAYSALFAVLAFIVVIVIVTLAGQSEAQREEVASTFNLPEYRTVEVIDEQGLGVIPWESVDRAGRLRGVENAWALGSAFEVTNSAVPERGRVSARMLSSEWSELPVRLLSGRLPTTAGEALVDETAAQLLGFDDTGGAVTSTAGAEWAVVGTYSPMHRRAPSTVLVPAQGAAEARSLSITVESVQGVAPMISVIGVLTDATAPGQYVVDRSADAGQLDAAVTSTVSRHGVMIVVTTMMTSAAVIALLSVLMVHTRRQEFGRRRALGATRSALVALVVLQGGIVVTAGAALGLVAGAGLSTARFGSSPPWTLLVAILVTTVSGSALAQVPSALAAGLRDPVRVLRTP